MGKHDETLSPEERAAVLADARELAQAFAAVGAQADADNRFPVELVPLYKRSGLPALAVPRELGGRGADVWTVTLVSRELAKGDPAAALAFNMHQTMVGILRGLLDPPAQARTFARVVEEQAILCGAFSEDRAGLDGLADTVAVPDGRGGWRIRGRKTWATLCQGADLVAFNATVTEPDGSLPEDHRQHATREAVFVLSMDEPGIAIRETWDTMGMRATGTHTIVFDDVAAPAASRGGGFRDGLFAQFEWASLPFAGVYQGLAEKACDACRDILRTTSLGPTVAARDVHLRDIGYVQHGLGRMLLRTEASARALETTARILEEGRDADWEPDARTAWLDVGKVTATETAVEVTDAALRLVGGRAYRRGHVLERLYRDARAGPFHPLTTDQAYDRLGRAALGLLAPQEDRDAGAVAA